MQQSKDIAELERQLAAMAGDNSASAIAKRKQLEAELAEARQALEESYYERSIQNQQDALDQELEDFQEEKDAEIEKWEQYLEDIEAVVAESLGIVQANAEGVYDTLSAKAEEYDLTLSDAIMSPWQDGALAVSDYQTTFDTAMSSTMDQLEAIKMKWQEIIDKMAEAAVQEVKNQQKENNDYTSARPDPEPAPTTPPSNNNKSQEKQITVGGKINAGNAKIYASSSGDGAGSQYFASDPIYTVLQESNGYLLVRHHSQSSGYSGWFKKSDVKAYSKGTLGTKKNELAWIDEMGLEEIVLHADGNGKLAYLSKGSSVIPHDISENLMRLGSLDPSVMLDQNRPQIGLHPEIHNNEININMNIAEVVHIDEVTNDTLPDLTKMVEKQMDSYMVKLNNSIKRFAR